MNIETSLTTELSLPADLAFNEADLAAFKAIIAANNLSREDSQALIDLAARSSRRGGKCALAKRDAEWHAARATWRDTVFNDPEIGLDNARLAKFYADSAVDQFGTPGLQGIFKTGWGDHPDMVRFCVAVGKALCRSVLQVEADQTPA